MIFFPRRQTKIGWLFLGVGFMVLLLCALNSQGFTRISWQETTRRKFLLYNGPSIELFSSRTLAQTFVANYPGLSQVDVLFNLAENAAEQTVIFHLKVDCASEDDVITLSHQLPAGDGFAFQTFEFPPLDTSTNQHYCILLEAPDASLDAPLKLPSSIGDLYPYGGMTILMPDVTPENQPVSIPQNDPIPSKYILYLPLIINQNVDRQHFDSNPRSEDIGFRMHYTGRLWPTVQVFMTRLTANKPYFLGQPCFYVGLILTYTFLLAKLFYVAHKTISWRR